MRSFYLILPFLLICCAYVNGTATTTNDDNCFHEMSIPLTPGDLNPVKKSGITEECVRVVKENVVLKNNNTLLVVSKRRKRPLINVLNWWLNRREIRRDNATFSQLKSVFYYFKNGPKVPKSEKKFEVVMTAWIIVATMTVSFVLSPVFYFMDLREQKKKRAAEKEAALQKKTEKSQGSEASISEQASATQQQTSQAENNTSMKPSSSQTEAPTNKGTSQSEAQKSEAPKNENSEAPKNETLKSEAPKPEEVSKPEVPNTQKSAASG